MSFAEISGSGYEWIFFLPIPTGFALAYAIWRYEQWKNTQNDRRPQ